LRGRESVRILLGKLTALLRAPRRERRGENRREDEEEEGNPTLAAGFYLLDGEKFNPNGIRQSPLVVKNYGRGSGCDHATAQCRKVCARLHVCTIALFVEAGIMGARRTS